MRDSEEDKSGNIVRIKQEIIMMDIMRDDVRMKQEIITMDIVRDMLVGCVVMGISWLN
jgi:hypothetical protein